MELGSGDNGGNIDEEDEEDFTTDVKHTDIDPTTTDDEDVDSQCMALFYLIFNFIYFSHSIYLERVSQLTIYDEHFSGGYFLFGTHL